PDLRSSRSGGAPGRGVQSLSSRGATQPSNPMSPGVPPGQQQPGQQIGQVQPAMAQAQRPPTPAGPQSSSPGGAPPGSQAAPPDIRIIADEINNLLLIKANPADYQRIMTVLRRIDRAPLQVMINATIAE